MFNKKDEPPDNEKPIENDLYSKDADQTRFLRMAFTLAMTVVIGLFLLEFFHGQQKAMLFTPEIVHILVNGLALAFFGLGTYIYGKSVGANEALAKMAGVGNGNGNQKQEQTQQGAQQTPKN